jgi:hypothetical protein
MNPAPDEDTLLTLIETNDHLSIAMSKHQRALLQARRNLSNSSPAAASSQADQVNYPAPAGPPPGILATGSTQDHAYPAPSPPPQRAQDHFYNPPPNMPPQRAQPTPQQQRERYDDVAENPFADEAHQPAPLKQSYGLFQRPNQAGPPLGGDQYLPYTEALQTRPQNQTATFHSTPGYTYRQEPAANNLTMHGATPPPGQQDRNDAQQRMGNMRV